MFQRIAIVAAIGYCCLTSRAEPPKAPPAAVPNYLDPASTPDEKLANQMIVKKLEMVIPDVRFDDLRLSDAIDRLHQLSGVPIFVAWKPLEEAGIHRDSPVTLHLTGRRLATILSLTLEIAGVEREKTGFEIDTDVITISTLHELAKNVNTRVYDMRAVIDAPGGPARDVRVDHIFKLLMDAIDSQSWKPRGGDIGSIKELQGQLIITQTPENHARIAVMIKNLIAIAEPGKPAK